jgi:hypothetical protein
MPTEAAHPPHVLVKARLAHRSERRLRLRLAEPPGSAARDIADTVARVEGVARARTRPNTSSVIIDTLVPAETVLKTLQDSGVFKLLPAVKPVPVAQAISLGLARADMAIGHQTEGALDLRTVFGLALLAAAGGQLVRGRIAGPALTLGMSAYSLLAPRR